MRKSHQRLPHKTVEEPLVNKNIESIKKVLFLNLETLNSRSRCGTS